VLALSQDHAVCEGTKRNLQANHLLLYTRVCMCVWNKFF